MVGPVSQEERSATFRRLKVGFVVLVGSSTGLISLQGDVAVPVVVAAIGAGLVVGALIVWLAFPAAEDFDHRSSRRR